MATEKNHLSYLLTIGSQLTLLFYRFQGYYMYVGMYIMVRIWSPPSHRGARNAGTLTSDSPPWQMIIIGSRWLTIQLNTLRENQKCVQLLLCTCIYIYIFIQLFIYVSLHICTYTMCIYACECIYIYVCVCLFRFRFSLKPILWLTHIEKKH